MYKISSLLVWALPISFCLHVMEEFLLPGGFIEWYHRYRPKFARVKPSHYVKVNGIGFLLILETAIKASKGSGYNGLLIVWGLLSCNAVFTHLLGAVKTRQYSPGMVTGIALYLPLTVLSYIAVVQLNRMDLFSLLFCIAVSPLLEIVFLKRPAPAA